MRDRKAPLLTRLTTLKEVYDEIIRRINEEIARINPRGNVLTIKVVRISPSPPDVILAVSLLKLICRETSACEVTAWKTKPRSNKVRDWRLTIYLQRWRGVNFEEVWQKINSQV